MKRWLLVLMIVCGGAGQIHAQTGVNSSSNPSFIGQPVTFTAMVSGLTNNLLPTGSVVFRDGAADLATMNLGSDGTAVLTITTLGLGEHLITATYSGDSNYQAVTTAPFRQSVVTGNTFTLAANPTVLQILDGQSAAIDVTVTGGPGFSDPVNLSCSGLPAGATCAFGPSSSVTPTPAGVAAQMSVNTTSMQRVARSEAPRRPFAYAMLLPLAFVGYFGVGNRKFRSATMAVFLVLLVGIGGCHKTTFVRRGTPAGTYTIQVTGVSANAVQATTLTLVVR